MSLTTTVRIEGKWSDFLCATETGQRGIWVMVAITGSLFSWFVTIAYIGRKSRMPLTTGVAESRTTYSQRNDIFASSRKRLDSIFLKLWASSTTSSV